MSDSHVDDDLWTELLDMALNGDDFVIRYQRTLVFREMVHTHDQINEIKLRIEETSDRDIKEILNKEIDKLEARLIKICALIINW